MSAWYMWAGTALIGASVAVAELLSRYREANLVWRSPAAHVYVALNGGASMFALYFLARQFPAGEPVSLVLASGVVAMALFRTSLFVVRVGETDVAIGPGGLLQLLLGAADRSVDRLVGAERSQTVAEIMNHVSFDKAYLSLPVSCLNLMQGLPESEQAAMGQEIKDLAGVAIPDHAKAYNMGLILVHAVGESVLRAAVQALGQSIMRAPNEPRVVTGINELTTEIQA
jgi:hypothetical protein